MQRFFLFFMATIICTGCSRDYGEFIKYHDDGRMKPRVAFVPVIDRSQQDLPWDVSDELTIGMREKLRLNGQLYLTKPQSIRRAYLTRSAEEWLSGDLEELRIFAPEHDFVVLTELVDHKHELYKRQKIKPVYPAKGEVGSVLMMTAHVRVIDIRQEEPRVVLNQYVHSNHMIPKKRMDLDYRQIPWKATTYLETPVGRAHARLQRDLVAQVEQYVTYHAK